MRNPTRYLIACLAIFAFAALAQTNTNTVPVPGPGGVVPGSGLGFLLTIVPLLTPILIAVLKWAVPKVPSTLLPVLAPALGIVIDWIGSAVGHGTPNPLVAAFAGAAGTGLYEIQKQIRQQVAAKLEQPPTT